MRKYIFCDIDHCVSNAFHRDAMIGVGSWDDYHSASCDDVGLQDVIDLINALPDDFIVIGLTSRPEKWSALTIKWLEDHGVEFDEVMFRPNEDFRSAPEVKADQAVARFGSLDAMKENVLVIFDDNEGVVKKFIELGVTAMLVYARH